MSFKTLQVYGNDYDTVDGTGVRDYIHVVDLVNGHVAALKKIFSEDLVGVKVYNLGTGKGTISISLKSSNIQLIQKIHRELGP